MRVIAGIAKGTKLLSPHGRAIRPTSDLVKEAIFDKLGEAVTDADVLDLYAGSGALGIEALSRGAKSATFLDSSFKSINLLKMNLERTHLEGASKILKRDILAGLKAIKKEGLIFDVVFMDPPYRVGQNKIRAVLGVLAGGVLRSRGIAVLEHSTRFEVPEVEGFEVVDVKKYGDTAISYFRVISGSD